MKDGFFEGDLFTNCNLIYDTCSGCLHKKDEKFHLSGNFKKKILILTEKPINTAQSIILNKVMSKYNVNITTDCFITECFGCGSAGQETQCNVKLHETIKEIKPKVIITFGEIALGEVLKPFTQQSISKLNEWTGYNIPLHAYEAILIPTFVINEIVEDIAIRKEIERNLKLNYSTEDNYLSYRKYKDYKKYIKQTTVEESINLMNGLIDNPETIAIDYETNCISPFREKAKLVSCAIYAQGISHAFFVTHKNIPVLKEVLENHNINKIIANVGFEKGWTNKYLDCELNGDLDDVIIQNAVLYNKKTNNVKHQTKVHLGIFDYNSEVEDKLKSEYPEVYNDIEDIELYTLLEYNAMDSLFEYWLFEKHSNKFQTENEELNNAYKLLNDGNTALAEMSYNGLNIDIDFYDKQVKIINKKIEELTIEFEKDEIIKIWKEIYGKEYNLNSRDQLAYILFTHLKYEPIAYTPTGNPKLDKDTLTFYNVSFLGIREEIGKLTRARDTFINQMYVNNIDNKVYPNYLLTNVPSYRSACYSPNFQNIPKHDDEVSYYVRGGVIPSKGNMLLEADFSGAEVMTGYSYHQDPKMYEYLTDPESDMHRDVAMDIFKLPKSLMTSELRYQGKNGFTFAEFYGSFYKPIAETMWRNIEKLGLRLSDGIELKKHLIFKGIKTKNDFEIHMKKVEDIFWNERFSAYKNWKTEIVDKYRDEGYFQSLTGFIYRGNLTERQICNFPIQGSSFHCLLWSIIRLTYYFKFYELKSKLVGQIHDSLIVDLVPGEKSAVLHLMKKVMEKEVMEVNKWIKIPFKVDFEITGIDEAWYYKKEI